MARWHTNSGVSPHHVLLVLDLARQSHGRDGGGRAQRATSTGGGNELVSEATVRLWREGVHRRVAVGVDVLVPEPAEGGIVLSGKDRRVVGVAGQEQAAGDLHAHGAYEGVSHLSRGCD